MEEFLSKSWLGVATSERPSKLDTRPNYETSFGRVPSLATVFDVFDVWGVASQCRYDF